MTLSSLSGDESAPAAVESPGEPAPKGRSLRENVGWTMAGNAFYLASQWGLLLILAKATSADDVGRYGIALAVTAPVFAFTQLQLRSVLVADVVGRHEDAVYGALRLRLTGLGWAGVVAFSLWCYPASVAWIIAGVATMKAVESLSELCWAIFQRDERMDLVARSMGWKGALTLGFAGVGVALSGTVRGLVAGALLAWILTAVIYDARLAKRRSPGLWAAKPSHGPEVRTLLTATTSLGLVTALLALAVNIPRYVIEADVGTESLGYFTAVAALPTAVGTLVIAVGQAASARLANMYAAGQRMGPLLWKLSALASGLAAAGTLGAWLWGPWGLSLLFSPDYAHLAPLLMWLFAASAPSFVAAILVCGLFAVSEYSGQLVVVGAMAVVIVSASWLWIPRYGLPGAAAALASGSLVQCLGYLALLRRKLSVTPEGR